MKNLIVDSFNFTTSMFATVIRTGTGITSAIAPVKPEKVLKLYDIESCPYCRLVREALTELDLDVEIYPCPKRGERYRQYVQETGGKAQFPFLVDDNTGVKLYESIDIIEYLFETYMQTRLPFKWKLAMLQQLGSKMASVARVGRGNKKRSSNPPEKLLELYSFESSPYARPVRERLCELEIPYLLRNCGRTEISEWLLPPVRDFLKLKPKSELKNRKELLARAGRMAIPYLVDPNQGIEMFESADIVDYLDQEYGNA